MNSHVSEFAHSIGVYSPTDFSIVGGSGARVFDEKGKSYLDCVGGHGVANVGHANVFIAEAVQKAWTDYAFATSKHPHPVREKFYERLAQKMPRGVEKFFMSNSGAEAVEAALKFARLATGKTQILAAKRAFHGRTMGALSATFRPEFREPFLPLVPDFDFFAFNKVESLAEKISAKTAAVILEVVQGEAGIYVGTSEFFRGVRELCDRFGALLIIDEVQTGVCRTGKFLATEHVGVTPDILVMAKALGGGYPLGVTAVRNDLFSAPIIGRHASTFGGNLPACAAGLAVLEFVEREKLAERAEKLGAQLITALQKISSPRIKEVRGLGLMIALEFTESAAPIIEAMKNEGVLVLPTGPKTIRLLPPLVITEAELEEIAEKLRQVLLG